MTFDIGTGFNSVVYAIDIQPDGKILVGGTFTLYNDTTVNRIIRLNSNGSIDTSFNIGTGFSNGAVYTIDIQPDGKILIGGNFTTYNSTTRNGIIRLNPNGSIDTSFNIGTGFFFGSGFNSTVYTIDIQPDGKILVGGFFKTYNGTTSNGIIRLNSNGSIDTSFNIGTGFSGSVYAIDIQPDGKILVGGTFTTYNSTTINRIVRLNSNGSIDTSFNIGTGFNNGVNTIDIQPDGKILVGGHFTTYNGTERNRIIRLNSNGSIDTSFNIGTGFNSNVNTIDIQPDGKILISGTFTTYNSTTRNGIVRLNSNGSIDTSFNIGTGFSNSVVNTIDIQPDGKILVGGNFILYNGTTSNRIIRLNPNGSIEEDIPIVITEPLRLATFEWLNAQEWLTKKGATKGATKDVTKDVTKKAVTKSELIQYYNINQTLVADITSDRNVIRDRVRPI